jgi:CxxC motif-containing protein
MLKEKLTCIVCPIGCHLEVIKIDGKFEISGNKCPRGEKYAIMEMTNPTRIVTTTVIIKNARLSRFPVKTSAPVPKKDIFKVMEVINKIEVIAPIKIGDIIISNILNLDVDIVATRSMKSVI